MHWASAMAGFMQTAPPKTNSATVMPKDQVVIANMWPDPWYLVPFSTVSQWTPTPKMIISAVLPNSARMLWDIPSPPCVVWRTVGQARCGWRDAHITDSIVMGWLHGSRMRQKALWGFWWVAQARTVRDSRHKELLPACHSASPSGTQTAHSAPPSGTKVGICAVAKKCRAIRCHRVARPSRTRRLCAYTYAMRLPKNIPVWAFECAIALSALIWGASFVVVKGALDAVTPGWL